MATVTKTNYSTRANNVAGFVEKYWMHILGAIVLIPWIIKYLRKMNWSLEEQTEEHEKDIQFKETRDPEILDQMCRQVYNAWKARPGVVMNYGYETLKGAAIKLSHDLGTVYSDTPDWWCVLDPRGWSENDKGAYETCVAVWDDLQTVAQMYWCCTRRRNLTNDLNKYLDPELNALLDGMSTIE